MIALLAPLAIVAPQADAPVFARNGTVGIVLPTAMREAAAFAGFEDPTSGASITIAELPAEANAQVVARLDQGSELPNGVTLGGAGTALTLNDGTPARLYSGTQTANGIAYAKWVLLVGGKAVTAVVTAQAPEPARAKIGGAIETALRSVTLRAPAGVKSEIAALPYTIDDRAGFRPVRTLIGSAVVLTEGPLDIDPDNSQPIIIVASSLSAAALADRAGTARAAFDKLGGMDDVTIASQAAPGPDSHRIAGSASSKGKALGLIQHMRFGANGGYVRTICIAPPDIDIAARCDRLAGSIALRP